jgi:hypothetical protein
MAARLHTEAELRPFSLPAIKPVHSGKRDLRIPWKSPVTIFILGWKTWVYEGLRELYHS